MKTLKVCYSLTLILKTTFSGHRKKSKNLILSITIKEESRLKVRNNNLNNNLRMSLSQKKSHKNLRRRPKRKSKIKENKKGNKIAKKSELLGKKFKK